LYRRHTKHTKQSKKTTNSNQNLTKKGTGKTNSLKRNNSKGSKEAYTMGNKEKKVIKRYEK
jgi:hypothetical protein